MMDIIRVNSVNEGKGVIGNHFMVDRRTLGKQLQVSCFVLPKGKVIEAAVAVLVHSLMAKFTRISFIDGLRA